MGRKTAGEKKVKDPNKPKRPTSSYFYFVAKEREEAKKRGDDISRVAEWTKVVSAKWRELTDAQKKPFEALAKTDKGRYEQAMAAYGGSSGKRPKDENKPKRAQSAYFLFLADFRAKQKANFQHEGGHKDLIRAAGEAWNKLSAGEKAPYEKKNRAEKEKYEVAMAAYTAEGASAAKKKKADNGAAVAAAAAAAAAVEDDDEDDEEEEEEEESD